MYYREVGDREREGGREGGRERWTWRKGMTVEKREYAS